MRFPACGAACLVALFGFAASAQDVTLTARGGGLELAGTLRAFDGEFYKIDTRYGLLTVDAQGVICDGPGCPGLTAPRAVIRIVGEADPGRRLMPALIRAFANFRRLTLQETGTTTRLTDPQSGQLLAEVSFAPLPPDAALAALAADQADMVLATQAPEGLVSHLLGLDALVPIVAPDHPVTQISTADLARVLAGQVKNSAEIGGPDRPLVLHGLPADSGLSLSLSARLGKALHQGQTDPDLAALAQSVARDPWAIAVTAQSSAGAARVLSLTDSCGYPVPATRLAVKADDYPLTLAHYLLTPPRRLPLLAREFVEFLTYPQAQRAIAQAGYVDRLAESGPLLDDGLRLSNAIRSAGQEITLQDLQGLTGAMQGSIRLSLSFRFEDGTTRLDAASRDRLADLARLIEIGSFKGRDLTLVGFSDGSGAAPANLALSQDRVDAVAQALGAALPAASARPSVLAFGEALPIACDETPAGRRLNRRVEVWLRPLPSK